MRLQHYGSLVNVEVRKTQMLVEAWRQGGQNVEESKL